VIEPAGPLAADHAGGNADRGMARRDFCHVAMDGRRRPLRRLQSGSILRSQLVRPGDGFAPASRFPTSPCATKSFNLSYLPVTISNRDCGAGVPPCRFSGRRDACTTIRGENDVRRVCGPDGNKVIAPMRYPAGPSPRAARAICRPSGCWTRRKCAAGCRQCARSVRRRHHLRLGGGSPQPDTGRCCFCPPVRAACGGGRSHFRAIINWPFAGAKISSCAAPARLSAVTLDETSRPAVPPTRSSSAKVQRRRLQCLRSRHQPCWEPWLGTWSLRHPVRRLRRGPQTGC